MNNRIKPFPYDVIETPTAIILVFASQTGPCSEATKIVTDIGIQITRDDGVMIRVANLHPRVRDQIDKKSLFVIDIGSDQPLLYPVGKADEPNSTLLQILPSEFYCYIGPETSNVRDVASRPAVQMFSRILNRPVIIAPGDTESGPSIGLCQSHPTFLPLAIGRKWSLAAKGVIIDAGLAAGSTTGYPANDNIPASVKSAHADQLELPEFRPRRAWSSHIACAFPPSNDTAA